ncbi:MAG: nicotinate-nucleotide--dimethylbenzimidazole phosphoribosyltransferase [Firmicutes bacterium HGW-Firmicutes-12]|nr:MAG: nicotinate-nucleotide--dimethylbenzimidazole phosphoribosyltransferase [Firmicutes bacterium HGW-Firmicutes-12]
MTALFDQTISTIVPVDESAMTQARTKLDGLLKPVGSLGKLEELAVQLAGIYRDPLPQIKAKAIVMMAADNGVYEEGFHAYPQNITKVLAELAGPGLIGICVLARQADSRLVVVDVGIKGKTVGDHILHKKVRDGTANISRGPAMSKEEAIKAIEVGIETVYKLADEGVGIFGTGEAGICNTTTTAAVLSAITGISPEEIVGYGTGQDEKAFQLKLEAVKNSLAINQPDAEDIIDIIAKVGGLDIAGLVGCYLGAAAQKKPIIIDGFIAQTAALAAQRLNPLTRQYMIPSHLSAEKGAQIVFEQLHMEPMLLLNMRLGEGTGAALAFHLVDASCRIINEMGSFADLA